MQSRFFFELFPSCRPEQSDDDDDGKDEGFNPFRFIGSICNYYHFGVDEVTKNIWFQQLLMLSASAPKYKSKDQKEKEEEERPKDFTSFIMGKM